MMTSYLLLITFLTNGIQTLQYLWWNCVECKEDYVEKLNLIWSHSIRVSWSAYELFSWPSCSYVDWGCRIHRLYLGTNECRDMISNNAVVMLQLWGMRSTPSLPLLPGSLWPGVVAPHKVLSLSNRTVWHLNWVQTNYLC